MSFLTVFEEAEVKHENILLTYALPAKCHAEPHIKTILNIIQTNSYTHTPTDPHFF